MWFGRENYPEVDDGRDGGEGKGEKRKLLRFSCRIFGNSHFHEKIRVCLRIW